MNDDIINWIHTLPGSILGWLDRMQSQRWGFYKDCYDAEMEYVFPASHVALRLVKMLRKADDISKLPGYSQHQSKANVEYIQSCQQPAGGFFIDPMLDSRFKAPGDSAALEAFRRTVTKYTIEMLGEHYNALPLYSYSESGDDGNPDPRTFLNYLKHADWDKPWATNSHAGGKVRELFNCINIGNEEFITPLREGLEIILSHQNPQTGMWGACEIPLYEQISGALKIINRLKFYMGVDLPYMDKLADSCIKHHVDGGFYKDADNMCFPRNVAEMCVACLEQSDYRRGDLMKTLASIAKMIGEYQQPDGAFATSKCGREALTWCGGRICGESAVPRSNITGTQGAAWGLGMIGHYLDWPDMPFSDPQENWRERIAKQKYRIIVDSKGRVEIVKKTV